MNMNIQQVGQPIPLRKMLPLGTQSGSSGVSGSGQFGMLLNHLRTHAQSSSQATPATGATGAADAETEKKKAKLREACNEFEGVLTSYLLKISNDSESVKGYLDKNAGEKYFSSMLCDQRAEETSKKGGLGLGKLIFDQIVRAVIKV
jgi:Rod binding domain-containing protein